MKRLEEKIVTVYRSVFIYVMSKIGNEDEARDVTQSVMEIVIRKIDTLRGEKSFRPWVMKIAKNEVNAYFNRIIKYKQLFADNEKVLSDGTCISVLEIADIKADILEKLASEEDKINIMIALERIDSKYHDVIQLNVICEHNLIKTAEILDINVNTARTWSARGLVKLKEEFEKLDLGEQI